VFGFVIGAAFLLLAGLAFWRGRAIWPAPAVVSAVLILAAAVAPGLLAPLNALWLKLALLLSRIVNPVAMLVVYCLLIVPTGLIMRALGRRPIDLGYNPELVSYWRRREAAAPLPDSMKRQF
jgi:hypothetical protein